MINKTPRRILAVLMLLAIAWSLRNNESSAQDAATTPSLELRQDPGIVRDAAPLTLTRTEILENRVIGLEMGQFEMLRDRCFPDPGKTVRAQVEELNRLIQGHLARRGALELEIVKAHGLDPAKYRVNWKDSKIEEKGAKQ